MNNVMQKAPAKVIILNKHIDDQGVVNKAYLRATGMIFSFQSLHLYTCSMGSIILYIKPECSVKKLTYSKAFFRSLQCYYLSI